MLGRYEIAVDDNGFCSWNVEEGEPKIHLLLVSLIHLNEVLISNLDQEHDLKESASMPPSPVVGSPGLVASAIPPSFHTRHSRSRSLSPLSRLSIPETSSVASGSFASGSETPTLGGPSALSRADKNDLLEYLGLDPELPYLGPANLHIAFQKHVAIVQVTEQIAKLPNDLEWAAYLAPRPVWSINLKDFIDIFIAKSQYYRTWKPLFKAAVKNPAMLAWLKLDNDRKPDNVIWGIEQESYGFEDLRKWLDNVKGNDVKEKRQVLASPKGKKKTDTRDRAVEKKKLKKKSKSKRKDTGSDSE